MKIALIVLSLITLAETTFLFLMKKEKNAMSFFKKDDEKEILLSTLKKKGVPVLKLSLEPHLAKWYQVELKNIPHPFFCNTGRTFFPGW